MAFGIRKPSIKKSIKAKKAVKKALDPTYGKKGAGVIKNPAKSVYNKVYNKTTKSIFDIFK